MLIPGESVQSGDRHFVVNERDIGHVAAMREYLIDVARAGKRCTYGELVDGADLPYLARGLGRLLALLAEDCDRRGEPGLASLVVAKSTGEVGSGYGSGAKAERSRVYMYWSKR